MLVKAKQTHIQPKTLEYRKEGEEFEAPSVYNDYVEQVKQAKSKPGQAEDK